MAKRHRTRPRTRRAIESARRAPAAHAEREAATAAPAAPVRRETHRPVRTGRGGYSRALGAPSPALERAAVLERGFVVKDFRRVFIVVGVALALLIVSGVLESTLLR